LVANSKRQKTNINTKEERIREAKRTWREVEKENEAKFTTEKGPRAEQKQSKDKGKQMFCS